MKRLICIIGLLLVLSIPVIARAECHYVWIDNRAYWVCDYTK
jgi:hypothetical protein